jgi:hypothetical protein
MTEKPLKPWVCKTCRTLVRSAVCPLPMTWGDGHRCEFVSPEAWERLCAERKAGEEGRR